MYTLMRLVSKINKQLVLLRAEKADQDQDLEEIKKRYKELKTKYDAMLLENQNQQSSETFINNIAELKRYCFHHALNHEEFPPCFTSWRYWQFLKLSLFVFLMYLEQKSCLFLDRTFTEKEENYHQEIQNLKIKIQVCLVYVMSFDIFIALIRVVKTFSFKLIIKFKKQKLSDFHSRLFG